MRFIVVAGARPNFMKVAPILAAFRNTPEHTVTLVHTGQHYDTQMSDNFFRDLGIPPPDVNLNIGSDSHARQTGRIMIAFEEVCEQVKPDWVLVVGDVNSTVACALTAKKLNISVAHVEAGLRSHDRTMPEEINRLCTDAISDLLFTTDTLADENLLREGVPAENIAFVGNTMIDTLLRHIEAARQLPLPGGLTEGGYVVVTLHRPSNVDSPDTLITLFRTIQEISVAIPVAFPVHPRTRARLDQCGLLAGTGNEFNIRLIDPLSYLPFLSLTARARMILTDSGGIQEEATVLGVPCLTMRENTERPITCQLGTNILTGCRPERILQAAREVLAAPPSPTRIPPLWDGRAAERIVARFLQ